MRVASLTVTTMQEVLPGNPRVYAASTVTRAARRSCPMRTSIPSLREKPSFFATSLAGALIGQGPFLLCHQEAHLQEGGQVFRRVLLGELDQILHYLHREFPRLASSALS